MNLQDHIQLESERSFLQRQLGSLPETARLTRSSTEARIKVIEHLLSRETPETRPARALLTFRGRPVIDSRGIFADFGSRATSLFADAVAAVGAALLGPLAATGPLPNRDQCQLLITGTAMGSFGFELAEYRTDQLPLFENETLAAKALEITFSILGSSTQGTDDELAEFASGISPRSIEAIRSFVDILASNEAVCTLVIGKMSFGFRDMGEVRRSLERLSQDNLHETETKLFGEFQGVLPEGRTFEFRLADESEVIRGKVGTEIADPAVINQHLHQPTEITVLETRVGDGGPRYRLLSLSEWDHPSQFS